MSTVLLRKVPGTSVVHRLWAGTKILGVLAVSIVLMLLPGWPLLGFTAVFLVAVAVLARVPLGAIPRFPWWIWAGIAIGGVLNVAVGTDAVLRYVQLVVWGFLLFGSSLILAWTTPMNEIAPAVSVLATPLRKLRLPVDEWAVAIALCLRSLPLLIEEMRILRASRRLRPNEIRRLGNARDNPLVDVITATMAVAMRRAGELGEAITARGGTGQLAAYPSRPGRADAIALTIVALVCAAGTAIAFLG